MLGIADGSLLVGPQNLWNICWNISCRITQTLAQIFSSKPGSHSGNCNWWTKPCCKMATWWWGWHPLLHFSTLLSTSTYQKIWSTLGEEKLIPVLTRVNQSTCHWKEGCHQISPYCATPVGQGPLYPSCSPPINNQNRRAVGASRLPLAVGLRSNQHAGSWTPKLSGIKISYLPEIAYPRIAVDKSFSW